MIELNENKKPSTGKRPEREETWTNKSAIKTEPSTHKEFPEN